MRGGDHERCIRRKSQDRVVDERVILAREVDVGIRRRVSDQDDVEIAIPSAKPPKRLVAKQICMQRGRGFPIGVNEFVDPVRRQDFVRIDELDAVGNAQRAVVGIEQDALPARDEARQSQFLVGAERRPGPKGADVLRGMLSDLLRGWYPKRDTVAR